MTNPSRFAVAVILAAASPPTPAQPPSNETVGDDRPGVYVPDSFEAVGALRAADRLAEAKRWREAAAAYQHAVEHYADKVIAQEPGKYVGVAEHVSRRIAAWPEAGLKVYRLLHAEPAHRRLAAARSGHDLDGLLSVVETYFCTREAATAADLAAQLAMEAGDLALAEWLYQRVIAHHPDRKVLAGELTGKLALALVWGGQIDRAQKLVERVRDKHPKATMPWKGRRRAVVEAVEAAIAERGEPLAPEQAFAWPMLGGNVQGNRVSEGEIQPSAPLWEYGPKQEFHPITADRAKRLSRGYGPARPGPPDAALSLVPVADASSLYLTDGLCVWAVRIANGATVWPPYTPIEVPDGRRPTSAGGETADLYACTLHDGRLYVVLGQPSGPVRQNLTEAAGLLACLDATSGKPIWSSKLADLDRQLAGIRLDGAPSVYRDKLFVVGRRRKRFGFEDCYLLRLDAASGRLEWMRHLASASVGSYGYRRATLALVAVSEATALVCTNLGVVAAVDTYDGRLRWLRVYHKNQSEQEAGIRLARRLPPWRFGPPVCWRDRLIFAPLDSERVFVVRRSDGEFVQQIEAGQLGHFEQILGVLDDVLYAAGSELAAWDLVGGELLWSRSLSSGGELLGRGQLTRTHVYLPMSRGLRRFDLRGGRPDSYDWPEGTIGGNVLVTPQQIVVTSHDRLTGYAPKATAFARLQQQIDAAPKDPVPLLDLAEIAFRVGERERALDALGRAVTVAGGFAQLADPQVRARIFRDFIDFGDRVMKEEPPDEALALTLYRQAAQCPPDPTGQVVYRMRLADALIALRQFERGIEQYQQIIADPSLRHRSARPRGSKTSWPAGQWAQKEIDAILAEHGRDAYEPFEREARALLTIGREQGDVDIIDRMIGTFPNARAARAGMLLKAELFEQRGEPRRAIRALRQALSRTPNGPDAPAVIHRIAEAYLRADRPGAARRWLARGARSFPDHRFDHQGRSTGFADYARWVSEARPVRVPRPAFSLPLAKGWSREFPGWVSVLSPKHADLPATRWDLFVTYCGGEVEAFAAPGNQPLWSEPVPCKGRPTLLGMTRSRLVLLTPARLFGVEIDTGRTVWSVDAYPPDADGPNADPEDLRKWMTSTMTEDRAFAVLSDGEAVCVDADRGKVIWRCRQTQKTETRSVANDEVFIYEAPPSDMQGFVFHVLDAETGRPLQKIESQRTDRVRWMDLSQQGLLLIATTREYAAVDPDTGKSVWRVRTEAPGFRATMLCGPEGLYVSHDGRTLVRRSLETGQAVNQSPELFGAERGGVIPSLDGDRLFALTAQAVTALDARTLAPVWRGTTDRNVSLAVYGVGTPYVVAIDRLSNAQFGLPGRRYFAYFYDRRDDSGRLDGEHGHVDLGSYENARSVSFADHTLLIADGNTLHGWTGPGN